MNKKRQREIAYLKLNKNGRGFTMLIQAAHAQRLMDHFLNKSVSFVQHGQGAEAEAFLEFAEGEDIARLERLLQEWKENFVSSGDHFW
jgi:hypothetical protein